VEADAVCRVLQRLVRLCGEVRASPAEADEVMFLCTLCSKLKDDPYLINFFIEVHQSASSFFDHITISLPENCKKLQETTGDHKDSYILNMMLNFAQNWPPMARKTWPI